MRTQDSDVKEIDDLFAYTTVDEEIVSVALFDLVDRRQLLKICFGRQVQEVIVGGDLDNHEGNHGTRDYDKQSSKDAFNSLHGRLPGGN